ncbi:MAG: chromosome partitioning protein [Flavobacteriales bacterium]|nr:chromosome partitioning protein [Flavobacteriales bacterium]
MKVDKEKILNVLKQVLIDNNNLVDSGSIKNISIDNNNIKLDVSIENPTLQFKNKIRSEIKGVLEKTYDNVSIVVDFMINKTEEKTTSDIQNIIAISSGKGGVGKSTISSNLAIALQKQGFSVGLIDADIYGPSIPLMFDAEGEKPKLVNKNNKSLMAPVISYGVKIMSIGFFSDGSNAIVWRGPMATKALKQMIEQTDWGKLDYLLIDLPPGTSDIHLSLVQTLSLTGAIVVTTPQPVALIDARKAIDMFKMKQINVPVIGLIENMSWCLIDNNKHYIFGRDGGKNLSASEDILLLAEIPLNQSIREAADIGRPAALQETELGDVFVKLSQQVRDSINSRNKDLPKTKKVEITHNRGCN